LERASSAIKVIVHLKAKPEGGEIAEVGRKAQSSICRDAPIAMNDFVHTSRGDAEIPAELILTDAMGSRNSFKRISPGCIAGIFVISSTFLTYLNK